MAQGGQPYWLYLLGLHSAWVYMSDSSVAGEMTTKRWTRHSKEGWRRGQLESLKLMSKSQVSVTVRVLMLAASVSN